MTNESDEDDDCAHHICYSPFGGLKNWMEAIKSANNRPESDEAFQILQKHHDSVKCNAAQRPLDNIASKANAGNGFGSGFGYGYGIVACPACVYEGLPDLEKIKISGFKSKKFSASDLQKILAPSTLNTESAFEVTDENGSKKFYAIVTYSAEILKKSMVLGVGSGPVRHSYATLAELKKDRYGTMYVPNNKWGYASGNACSFPYIPEGS